MAQKAQRERERWTDVYLDQFRRELLNLRRAPPPFTRGPDPEGRERLAFWKYLRKIGNLARDLKPLPGKPAGFSAIEDVYLDLAISNGRFSVATHRRVGFVSLLYQQMVDIWQGVDPEGFAQAHRDSNVPDARVTLPQGFPALPLETLVQGLVQSKNVFGLVGFLAKDLPFVTRAPWVDQDTGRAMVKSAAAAVQSAADSAPPGMSRDVLDQAATRRRQPRRGLAFSVLRGSAAAVDHITAKLGTDPSPKKLWRVLQEGMDVTMGADLQDPPEALDMLELMAVRNWLSPQTSVVGARGKNDRDSLSGPGNGTMDLRLMGPVGVVKAIASPEGRRAMREDIIAAYDQVDAIDRTFGSVISPTNRIITTRREVQAIRDRFAGSPTTTRRRARAEEKESVTEERPAPSDVPSGSPPDEQAEAVTPSVTPAGLPVTPVPPVGRPRRLDVGVASTTSTEAARARDLTVSARSTAPSVPSAETVVRRGPPLRPPPPESRPGAPPTATPLPRAIASEFPDLTAPDFPSPLGSVDFDTAAHADKVEQQRILQGVLESQMQSVQEAKDRQRNGDDGAQPFAPDLPSTAATGPGVSSAETAPFSDVPSGVPSGTPVQGHPDEENQDEADNKSEDEEEDQEREEEKAEQLATQGGPPDARFQVETPAAVQALQFGVPAFSALAATKTGNELHNILRQTLTTQDTVPTAVVMQELDHFLRNPQVRDRPVPQDILTGVRGVLDFHQQADMLVVPLAARSPEQRALVEGANRLAGLRPYSKFGTDFWWRFATDENLRRFVAEGLNELTRREFGNTIDWGARLVADPIGGMAFLAELANREQQARTGVSDQPVGSVALGGLDRIFTTSMGRQVAAILEKSLPAETLLMNMDIEFTEAQERLAVGRFMRVMESPPQFQDTIREGLTHHLFQMAPSELAELRDIVREHDALLFQLGSAMDSGPFRELVDASFRGLSRSDLSSRINNLMGTGVGTLTARHFQRWGQLIQRLNPHAIDYVLKQHHAAVVQDVRMTIRRITRGFTIARAAGNGDALKELNSVLNRVKNGTLSCYHANALLDHLYGHGTMQTIVRADHESMHAQWFLQRTSGDVGERRRAQAVGQAEQQVKQFAAAGTTPRKRPGEFARGLAAGEAFLQTPISVPGQQRVGADKRGLVGLSTGRRGLPSGVPATGGRPQFIPGTQLGRAEEASVRRGRQAGIRFPGKRDRGLTPTPPPGPPGVPPVPPVPPVPEAKEGKEEKEQKEEQIQAGDVRAAEGVLIGTPVRSARPFTEEDMAKWPGLSAVEREELRQVFARHRRALAFKGRKINQEADVDLIRGLLRNFINERRVAAGAEIALEDTLIGLPANLRGDAPPGVPPGAAPASTPSVSTTPSTTPSVSTTPSTTPSVRPGARPGAAPAVLPRPANLNTRDEEYWNRIDSVAHQSLNHRNTFGEGQVADNPGLWREGQHFRDKFVIEYPEGVLEFHPRNAQEVAEMKKMITDQGELFEVDSRLGRLREIQLDEIQPMNAYLWVPHGAHLPNNPVSQMRAHLARSTATGGGFGQAPRLRNNFLHGGHPTGGGFTPAVHNDGIRDRCLCPTRAMRDLVWEANDHQVPLSLRSYRSRHAYDAANVGSFAPTGRNFQLHSHEYAAELGGTLFHDVMHNKHAKTPNRPVGGGFLSDVGDTLSGAAEDVGTAMETGVHAVIDHGGAAVKWTGDALSGLGDEMWKHAKKFGQSEERVFHDMSKGLAAGSKGFVDFFDDPSMETAGRTLGSVGKMGAALGEGALRASGETVNFVRSTPILDQADFALRQSFPEWGILETGISIGNRASHEDWAGVAGDVAGFAAGQLVGKIAKGAGKKIVSGFASAFRG